MMEAGSKYRLTIDGRIQEGTSPTDIIALIALPGMGREIFMSWTVMA